MREIKFRGYNAKNQQWLYGFYLQNRGRHFVCPDEFANGKSWKDYEAIPETVGQFTGLLDKNGEEIYEGDILRIYYHGLNKVFGVVRYAESRFYIEDEFKNELTAKAPMADMFLRYQFEIVGNIHDNSELLKGETE